MNHNRILRWLQRTYVQHADARQKAMGLQYTEAETEELAISLARLFDELFADRVHELIGYVENGTDTTLKVFQDDATRTFHVHIGKREYWDSSLTAALHKALVDVRDEDRLI